MHFAAHGHWAGGWVGDAAAAGTLTTEATGAGAECCGTFVMMMLFLFTEMIHG